MWQRFTASARAVVRHAQLASVERGDSHVTTEDLLLGLLHPTIPNIRSLLVNQGVSIAKLSQEILREVPSVGGGHVPSELMFTLRARKALGLAEEEAQHLQHNNVAAAHLLLGFLVAEQEQSGGGLAGRLLVKHGATLVATRKAVSEFSQEEMADVLLFQPLNTACLVNAIAALSSLAAAGPLPDGKTNDDIQLMDFQNEFRNYVERVIADGDYWGKLPEKLALDLKGLSPPAGKENDLPRIAIIAASVVALTGAGPEDPAQVEKVHLRAALMRFRNATW